LVIKDVKAGASIGLYRLELAGEAGISTVEINSAYLTPEQTGVFLRPGSLNRSELELDDENEAALRDAAAATACEKAAQALITRAEQNAAGLRRKLLLKKHDETAVDRVIARLTSLGLVDDRRYAELWLKGAVSRGSKGPKALVLALRAKGIDKSAAEEALETALAAPTGAFSGDETAEDGLLRRCLKKAEKKLRKAAQARAKTGRAEEEPGKYAVKQFLKFEGFSPEAIERYFDNSNGSD
jgi:SOS response regulatory protein OraA/RecX